MERVYGCDCSLALAEDGFNSVVPIPYVRETVREVSKGFWPPVSLSGFRSQYVNYSYGAEGCFITRLDSQCSKNVMELIGLGGNDFNLVQDRTFIKKEYEHLKVREFSLYGENGKPFYFTAEVESGFGFVCSQVVVIRVDVKAAGCRIVKNSDLRNVGIVADQQPVL